MTTPTINAFCERCGTRTVREEAAQPRGGLFGRVRLLTARPADDVLDPLSLCLSCRGYVCAACLNDLAGLCQDCAPLVEVGADAWPTVEHSAFRAVAQAVVDVDERAAPTPIVDAVEEAAEPVLEPLAEVEAEAEADPGAGAEPEQEPYAESVSQADFGVMADLALESVALEDELTPIAEVELELVAVAEPEPEPTAPELQPEVELELVAVAEPEPEPIAPQLEVPPVPEFVELSPPPPPPPLPQAEPIAAMRIITPPSVVPQPIVLPPPPPRPTFVSAHSSAESPVEQAPEPITAEAEVAELPVSPAPTGAQLTDLSVEPAVLAQPSSAEPPSAAIDDDERVRLIQAQPVMPHLASRLAASRALAANGRAAQSVPMLTPAAPMPQSLRSRPAEAAPPGARACHHCDLPISTRASFCRRCGSSQPRVA